MSEVTPLKRKEPVEIPGFGSGCRVQLKSGGGEMVVREAKKGADGRYMVTCEWMLDDGSPMRK